MTLELDREDAYKILLTLQYCLETFEQACQCGLCGPCTHGQQDIQEGISRLDGALRAKETGSCTA